MADHTKKKKHVKGDPIDFLATSFQVSTRCASREMASHFRRSLGGLDGVLVRWRLFKGVENLTRGRIVATPGIQDVKLELTLLLETPLAPPPPCPLPAHGGYSD